MTTTLDIVPNKTGMNRFTNTNDQFIGWLNVDGVTVAHITFRYAAEAVRDANGVGTAAGLTINKVETRKEFRNQGHAKALIKMVVENCDNSTPNYGGHYTPLGWKYLRNHVVRPTWADAVHQINGRTYVTDWDARTIKY